jgi:hypothetical protein
MPCDDLVGGKRHIIQPQVKVMAAPGRASLAGKLAGLPAGHKTGTHRVAGRIKNASKIRVFVLGRPVLSWAPFLLKPMISLKCGLVDSADRYTNPGHSDRDLSNGASLQRLRRLPLEF